jgi:hypothetical protein
MISRGFEAVNTVFGGILVLEKKPRSLRERDVVKHGPYYRTLVFCEPVATGAEDFCVSRRNVHILVQTRQKILLKYD